MRAGDEMQGLRASRRRRASDIAGSPPLPRGLAPPTPAREHSPRGRRAVSTKGARAGRRAPRGGGPSPPAGVTARPPERHRRPESMARPRRIDKSRATSRARARAVRPERDPAGRRSGGPVLSNEEPPDCRGDPSTDRFPSTRRSRQLPGGREQSLRSSHDSSARAGRRGRRRAPRSIHGGGSPRGRARSSGEPSGRPSLRFPAAIPPGPAPRVRSSYGTCSEPGPYVATVRLVEIPPRVPQKPSPRRPGASAEHFVRVEPRLRVFFIRIDDEARVRTEARARPFPDVADHLPASPGALAHLARIDRHAAHSVPLEIRPADAWRVISPGEAPLRVGQRSASWRRNRCSGRLPFRLRGEPPPRPTAVCFRLVPVDVNDR